MTVIPISGVIGWDVTGQDIRKALADAKGDEIEIQLSSVGGLVFDGLEIFNLIKNYEGKKSARLMGIAASMGSYIPLAVKPEGKIIAEANAVMMIHNAWGMGAGNADDLRAEANVLDGLSAILANTYAEVTGKSLDDIKAMMDAETWLFGSEIKAAGFVDEVIGEPEEDTKDEKVKAARAELAGAKKIVAEYEGGDSPRRVAALVESMRPRVAIAEEKKPAVSVAAGTTASKPKGSIAKMNTLEELKAENPGLYALAESQFTAKGVKDERDRVAAINAFAPNGPAAAKVAAEAINAGKSFAEAMPELVAASSRGPAVQENAPNVATSTAAPSGLSVEGMDDKDVAALMAGNPKQGVKGMTIEEIRANAPAKEA